MHNSEFDPRQVYMPPMEAARLLDLSVMQVKELVWQKKLSSTKVFGRILLYRAEVEAFAGIGLKPNKEADAWAKQKELTQTHGIPANGQFSNS